VRKAHTRIETARKKFFARAKSSLELFVPADRLKKLIGSGKKVHAEVLPNIGTSEEYVHAVLRPYQVDGVNWMISQYNMGVGGILGDEMGLGKTIQTLAFIASLKAAGLPGPHLVVTPLAVLLNWTNEIRKFTPGLSFCKIHGSLEERDRILSRDDILEGTFDIYLTTYEVIQTEESFFTETLLWHTITIDEGHRLKNENSRLCLSLARLKAPFRLLLTGTPLQNNLHELWALLHYILPTVFNKGDAFDDACVAKPEELGTQDQGFMLTTRKLLETLMIRRVKSEVEKSLLPKQEFVLKVPMTPLQRQWYQRTLTKDEDMEQLMSFNQLMAVMMQLQKVVNHPKCLLIQMDRDREKAAAMARRAEGSEFVQVSKMSSEYASGELEEELRGLRAGEGNGLVAASAKLALLDRLLTKATKVGSRALIFTQFTLALDVLEEFCAERFGQKGVGYFRLDGSTNRIMREMDVNAFNSPGSTVPVYLISTRAGGQGINLASADVVVLYDSCWNPQVDLQAQDRAHRIGQTKQVKVYRLICEGTVEERVLARARQKLVLDAMMIKGGGGALNLKAVDEKEEGGGEMGAPSEMSKLTVAQLYSMLAHGAEALFDTGGPPPPPLTTAQYDDLIDGAKLYTIDTAAAAVDADSNDSNDSNEASVEEMPTKARDASRAPRTQKADGAACLKGTILGRAAHSAAGIRNPDRKGHALNGEHRPVPMKSEVRGHEQSSTHAAGIDPSPRKYNCGRCGLPKTDGCVCKAEAAAQRKATEAAPEPVLGKRERKSVKRFIPPPIKHVENSRRKQPLEHDEACFSCTDGGDLLEVGIQSMYSYSSRCIPMPVHCLS
jgi:SWI/SNF-related matrix-associated actin-dependent regulator of chromatin subfamily A member 5